MIAKIAVDAANFAIDKPYSYAIPTGMTLAPGMRVQVPFGRGNRRTEGVVLSVEQGETDGLKPVERALDDAPVLSATMLRLAAFMRERCFCTFFDAIRAMLPAGLWFHTKELYNLTEDRSWQDKTLRVAYARELLQFLVDAGGEAEGETLKTIAADEESFDKAISYLLRKKWITTQVDFLRRTADKTEKLATLAVPAEEAMAFASSRSRAALMQKNVLELMCSVGSASVKEICYFTGAKPGTVKRLVELGYLTLSEKPVLRCRDIRPAQLDGPLVLNEKQQLAFEGLA
ncbi:MAG: hypothetical protein J6Q54_05425 [Oscillospiraceae bacterium]|nr:hypothetical protein [Oscillospiraceae bacterium]